MLPMMSRRNLQPVRGQCRIACHSRHVADERVREQRLFTSYRQAIVSICLSIREFLIA